jgi:hypothetical protein
MLRARLAVLYLLTAIVTLACSAVPTEAVRTKIKTAAHALNDCTDSAFSGYTNPGGHC